MIYRFLDRAGEGGSSESEMTRTSVEGSMGVLLGFLLTGSDVVEDVVVECDGFFPRVSCRH